MSNTLNGYARLLIALGLLLGAGTAWARGNDCMDEDLIAIQTIVLEAGGESFDGMVAVGEVIRNRAKRGSRSVLSVCLLPYQFSCWNDQLGAYKRLGRVSGETWQTASRAWEASRDTNTVKGATMYANLSLCRPKWDWSKLERVGQLGAHTFWREKA